MLNKILKITAAAAFMVALAINIDMTLNDPFAGMSTEAIATDTDSSDTTGEWTCPGYKWIICEVNGVNKYVIRCTCKGGDTCYASWQELCDSDL